MSVFEPPLRKTPSTKPQAPEKFQISNTKPQIRCRGKRRAGRFLSFELGASLELGDWELGAFCWALRFSKVETRPQPGDPIEEKARTSTATVGLSRKPDTPQDPRNPAMPFLPPALPASAKAGC